VRGDGLLRNELYIGRLVWRRRINAKDPMSGARVRRDNRPGSHLVIEVPHLRIIDDELWRRVQARLQREAAPVRDGSPDTQPAFWLRRRPRHLLSGKAFCGVCDRPLSLFGQDYLGCKAGVHGTCRNRRTIRRAVLGMDMLRRQLMQPELVAEFVAEFRREWQRLLVESKARAGIDLRERAALDRKIANLPDAIFDGRTSPAVMARLAELEAQ
jgi:site-specific DNA recombinase